MAAGGAPLRPPAVCASDAYGRAGDVDAAAFRRRNGHRQEARPALVVALVDGHLRWWGDQVELAQVAAERRGGGTGRGVLDDPARRERVARMEDVSSLPPDQVDGGPAPLGHQVAQRGEVVVEVGQSLP